MKKIIPFLLIFILIITSCSSEPEVANGKLSIKIASSITKGISPTVDLETANYRIEIAEANGNSQTLNIGTDSAAEQSLPAGSYTAKAYAENAVGTVIGESEEKSFTIYPNRTTSVSLDIYEKEGNGSISLSFDGLDVFPAGTTFSVEFMTGIASSSELESAGSFPLEMGENGIASVTATLANGFYTFGLKSSDEAGSITLIDTVRIVNGDELSVSYSYSYAGNGEVTITNNIVKTPSIEVEKSGDELPITLSSTIENLDGNASYAWYMDGKLLSGANEKDLNITSESDISAGNHEFILIVISDTSIVWTSDAIDVLIQNSIRTIDLASIDLENGHEITVGADEQILFKNVNLSDGVVLTKVEGDALTKGIGNNGNGNGNNGFITQTGDFMLSPDKNMNAYFNGSNLGAKDNLRLKIKKFKNIDSDFAMTADEYAGSSGLAEEFYYVDFNSEEFKHLNPSEIVVTAHARTYKGTYTIPTLASFAGERRNGIHDLSSYSNTGFGIYAYVSSIFSSYENEYHVYIETPVALEKNKVIDLDKSVGVFKTIEDGNFKITFSFEGTNENDLVTLLSYNPELRYFDGSAPEYIMIPSVDFENKAITYYLKNAEKDMLFDYNFNAINYTSASMIFENAIEEEMPEFIDITTVTDDGIEVKAKSSDSYHIVPYTNNGTKVNVAYSAGCFKGDSYFRGPNTTSKGFEIDGRTGSGFLIVQNNAQEGDTLFTITPRIEEVKYLQDDHIVYDPETQNYKNDKGEVISIIGTNSFTNNFKSEQSFDFYGYIHWENTDSISTTYLDLNDYGNSSIFQEYNKMIGTFGQSNAMEHLDKAIDIRMKEIWLEDGIATKLLCLVHFGKTDTPNYQEVYFNLDVEASHEWEIQDREGIAICSKCNETRAFSIINIEPSVFAVTTEISGIKNPDTYVLMSIPEIDFFATGSNGSKDFGLVEEPFRVYLIPPTSDSNLIIKYQNNGVINIKVVYSN